MKIDPLKILFLLLFLFGIYLLINRMLGHSAPLEMIVTILTGSIFIAILDLYKSDRKLYILSGDIKERLTKIEKDVEQIKNHIVN